MFYLYVFSKLTSTFYCKRLLEHCLLWFLIVNLCAMSTTFLFLPSSFKKLMKSWRACFTGTVPTNWLSKYNLLSWTESQEQDLHITKSYIKNGYNIPIKNNVILHYKLKTTNPFLPDVILTAKQNEWWIHCYKWFP